MTNNNCKITDILSYLPSKQLSLTKIEEIFNDALMGKANSLYEVCFSHENIKLNEWQSLARKELGASKDLAYVLYNKEVVAIIAYVQV
nr:hypothetical protein [uncultured Cellulosilyticum sp.]